VFLCFSSLADLSLESEIVLRPTPVAAHICALSYCAFSNALWSVRRRQSVGHRYGRKPFGISFCSLALGMIMLPIDAPG